MAELLHLLCVPDMQNQRVILRPSLGFKYFRHSSFIQPIRAQAVNRLRRNRHQLTLPNQLSGNGRRLRIQGR